MSYAGPKPIRLTKIWAEVDEALDNMQKWPLTNIRGHLHNNLIPDGPTGKRVWRRELIANSHPPGSDGPNSLQPLLPVLNKMGRPLILDQMAFGYLELGANPGSVVRYGIETEEGILGPFEKKVEEIEVRS